VSEEVIEDEELTKDKRRALRLSSVLRHATDAKQRLVITHDTLDELAAGAPIPRTPTAYFDRAIEQIAALIPHNCLCVRCR
jgi:hypothetical protein